MKKQNLVILAAVVALLIVWSSCNKKVEAPVINIANEPLNTMLVIATNTSDPTDTPSAKWAQLDPNGILPPDVSHDTLVLRHNSTYNVQIHVLDSTTDKTSVILARQNYHLYCFDIAMGLNLTVARTDHDNNIPPLPIGLTDLFTTTGSSTGTLSIDQRHQPNVKDGTCPPGSTDIDAPFFVKIQ